MYCGLMVDSADPTWSVMKDIQLSYQQLESGYLESYNFWSLSKKENFI